MAGNGNVRSCYDVSRRERRVNTLAFRSDYKRVKIVSALQHVAVNTSYIVQNPHCFDFIRVHDTVFVHDQEIAPFGQVAVRNLNNGRITNHANNAFCNCLNRQFVSLVEFIRLSKQIVHTCANVYCSVSVRHKTVIKHSQSGKNSVCNGRFGRRGRQSFNRAGVVRPLSESVFIHKRYDLFTDLKLHHLRSAFCVHLIVVVTAVDRD